MESIGPALVTGVASIVVALVGLAANRKRARKAETRTEDPTIVLERRLWATVIIVMLALVVGDTVAPIWGVHLDFPLPAYAILISALVFWLQMSLSRKRRGGDDDE